jgi:hypothetical protein
MTSYSAPSQQQVSDAIETIWTFYSYDPPSRWLNAHILLRSLRRAQKDQLKPYRWIETTGVVLGLGALLAALWFLFLGAHIWTTWHPLQSSLVLATFVSAPGWIIAGGARLARAAARRRYPLIKLEDAIERAASRFEDRYSDIATRTART